jgi:uncharacterized protein
VAPRPDLLLKAAHRIETALAAMGETSTDMRPWHAEECTERECPCIVAQGRAGSFKEAFSVRYIADAETPEYGAFIALMDHRVARATANWLRVEASTWNGDEAHYSCKSDTCSYESALELALAVLGGSDE